MTLSNNGEIYELDFGFLKVQILETEWIHVNETWNANNHSAVESEVGPHH